MDTAVLLLFSFGDGDVELSLTPEYARLKVGRRYLWFTRETGEFDGESWDVV